MNLRKEARGRECQARISFVCNHDPETVVLHHVRLHSGMGRKPPDLLGAWVCDSCHNYIHMMGGDIEQTELDELHAMYRTIEILIEEGKIRW